MTTQLKKKNKSVSLNIDVYERLVVVCERLGVNVNAYLVNAVGQQLLRDEAPILAQEKVIEKMMSIMSQHLESEEHQEQAESIAKSFLENKKP